jgi:hypothetical protein
VSSELRPSRSPHQNLTGLPWINGYDVLVLAATWVLAVATAILALSGPVALFAWLSARRSDRVQRKQGQDAQMEERILKRAKDEFAPRSWATDTAGWGVLALVAVALIGWGNRQNSREP